MTNIVFMDVDGTLVANKDGRQFIPPSAIRAMEEAHARGTRIYLCTGRSLAEARTIGEVPIDGIIGAAGGFALDGDHMVFHHLLDREDVEELEAFLRDRRAHYYLECNEGLYFNPGFLQIALNEWGASTNEEWRKIIHPVEEADRSRINKVSFRSDDGGLTMDEVVEHFGRRFYIVPASYGRQDVVAAEMSCFGINKATAITQLLEHLDLDEVRTFGFGDSANDLEMLEACDEAIVMGDARDERMRDHATFVTSALLDDGVARAMQHFGLAN